MCARVCLHVYIYVSLVNWTESWWAISTLNVVVVCWSPPSPINILMKLTVIYLWRQQQRRRRHRNKMGTFNKTPCVKAQQHPNTIYHDKCINSKWNFMPKTTSNGTNAEEPKNLRKMMWSNGETKLKQQNKTKKKSGHNSNDNGTTANGSCIYSNGNNSTKHIKQDDGFETHTYRMRRKKRSNEIMSVIIEFICWWAWVNATQCGILYAYVCYSIWLCVLVCQSAQYNFIYMSVFFRLIQ